MKDPIDRYLTELRQELRVSPALAERVLTEAEDHLREGAVWEEDRGLTPEEAQAHVIERFGSPAVVARWWNEVYTREYGGGKMWQRFTERARRVVFFAQEEAARLGENYVGTEHLLLGLVREKDTVAARLLKKLKISAKRIKQDVEKQVTRGAGFKGEDMQLTPRAKRTIDLAYEEARSLGNDFIGTEHLLMGLIREEDGLGGRVLQQLGADLDPIRREVRAMQAEDKELLDQVKMGFLQAVERGTDLSPAMRSLISVLTSQDAGRLADAITPFVQVKAEDLAALQPSRPSTDRLEKLLELIGTAKIDLGEPKEGNGQPSETGFGHGEDKGERTARGDSASTHENQAVNDDARIERLAQAILQLASDERATTIQIEPRASQVVVWYEIDGVQHEKMKCPKGVQEKLVACYKQQHGDLDMRIEPTEFGEKLVISLRA